MIKTAVQILAEIEPEPRKPLGRPPLHRTCTLPGCTMSHNGHGMCTKHKYAKDRWGDPLHVWVRPRRSGRWGSKCGCPIHTPKGNHD